MKAEEKIKRRQEKKSNNRVGSSMRGRGGRGTTDFQSSNDKDKDKTFSESRGGYRGGRSGGRGNGVFMGRCFNYNEVGHQSFRCPKWEEDNGRERRVNLVEEEPRNNGQQEPIELHPEEEGEYLLMGRSNQIPKDPGIFRSNCLIQGKVCKFIIDSGVSNNVLSYEVVKKLNLKTFAHAAPYYATWVNENHNLLIKDQVMVEFLVGSKRDKVLYNVMYIYSGNLISGRSWQCSRRVMTDGYENTYVVQQGRMKYKLYPLVRSLY